MERGYIKIENPGEIDVNAFRLLGASTKRDDNTKIGFFGSGLKYAIAVLLRNEIPFRVFAGEKEIKIETKTETFRDKSFQMIKINGSRTSLTTDMGPDWEPWFAIREVYCNALDEGNANLTIVGDPAGEKDKTIFFVKFDDKLVHLFDNWDQYFSNKRKDLVHEQAGNRYFTGKQDLRVYRKGVLCHVEDKPSLYHYDLDWIDINESRVLKSDWDFKYNMPQKFAVTANTSMIRNLFENYKGTIEEDFFWEYVHKFNDHWLTVIGDHHLVIDSVAGYFVDEMKDKPCLVLPGKLVRALKQAFGERVKQIGFFSDDDEDSVIRLPNERESRYIQEACEFIREAGFNFNSEIKICHFKKDNVLGKAQTRNKEILLSPKLFDHGKKMIVAVILEEEAHLDSGMGDMTRGFQNYIFNKLVGLMEEKIGKFL